jgi:hypothetical protein
LNLARFLVEQGANVSAEDNDVWTLAAFDVVQQ